MHLAAFIEIASPQTPPSLFIALDALGETLAVPHRAFKFTNLLQIVNLLAKVAYIFLPPINVSRCSLFSELTCFEVTRPSNRPKDLKFH